ncbi:MAG: phosphate acyltransferase PlsX [Clostridia bacterium]
MSNKIVLDAFGGDNAPIEIVKGAVNSVLSQNEFDVCLVGKEDVIKSELSKYKFDENRIEIINASEIVTNDDVPTDAIKNKKDSSLVVGLDSFKKRDDLVGFVSAGSTGAVLTGSIFKVGRIRGISRPALAPILPTVNGGNVLMLDIGANVDCKPEYLCQFAIMGTAYMRDVYKVNSPRVALLSNGTEDKKGNALTKEVFPLLKEMSGINFVGNMEAREILSGEYDVIVTDGFAGNVALKGTEGAVLTVLALLKQEIMSSFMSKIGALFLKKSFKNLKRKLDYNKSGGAPLLGIDKVVVKSHGSSKAVSITASLKQAYDLYQSKYIDNIRNSVNKSEGINE